LWTFLQFVRYTVLISFLSPGFSQFQMARSTRETRLSEESLLHQFEEKYRKATRLQATFLEQYFENGKIVRIESGIAYFRKPGKMRWEYEKPEKNLFLVDGKNAWFYTPGDHTATRIPARQSDDWRAPLALLAGEGKLSRVCDRVLTAKLPSLSQPNLPAATGFGFECLLKGATKNPATDSQSEPDSRVFLEISENGNLTRVLIRSPGSVLTEFRFKDWVVDPPLPESLFHFAPPLGVVIVDGLLPSPTTARQK
jgi:outer membrane lipoprotein carrier protein